MDREEMSKVLGHEPFTFEQMKEIEQLHLQHDWEKLRNEYAGRAMQAIISNTDLMKEIAKAVDSTELARYNVVHNAVAYANALVEELKKAK